jgi:hypothetical protein
MTLLLRAGRLLLCAAVVASATPACFTAGGGNTPPTNIFYFPTALAVSDGGNVLYVVNSDFDLQWNGGTLQSYDLHQIREDAAALVDFNVGINQTAPAGIPLAPGYSWANGSPVPCTETAQPVSKSGGQVAPGEQCAPPVDSTQKRYFQEAVITGAFATDLRLVRQRGAGSSDSSRLFFPVRGTGTLSYADVAYDNPGAAPPFGPGPSPFDIDCGAGADHRCSGYQAGSNPSEQGNTRGLTMPGDPFGIALTEDGTAVVITHQSDTKTSLLTSGLGSQPPQTALQFVLDGLPFGGDGIVAIPHDYDALRALGTPACDDPNRDTMIGCVRPAFLQTSRAAAEIELLRYYSDDESTLHRPFIQRENPFPLTANAIGSDSRGIAVDPTPRLACKAKLGSNATVADKAACGQRPARVFIANRTPPSLVFGEVGESFAGGGYNPDALRILGTVPLSPGPSRVYVAPIVNAQGNYEMRVFVACFDSNTIFVFDPMFLDGVSNAVPEAVIYTGPGPFAMAFDPITPTCVANRADPSCPPCIQNPDGPSCGPVRPYRFAYVASFTQSYLQVIDLDSSDPRRAPYTFEQVVFTLGLPTPPKGQ